MQQVIKKKKSLFFVSWIVPIIALTISLVMINREYEKKGENIVIEFSDITGLEAKKSVVKYKGIEVGKIVNIRIDKENLNKFLVDVIMNKEYNYLVKNDTNFWKVSPKISLTKIENVGTVITGSYVAIMPKYSTRKELETLGFKRYFKSLDDQPIQSGVYTTLVSDDGNLGVNSIIVYKGIEVGKIINKKLVEDEIYYEILIYSEYKNLLSSQSNFAKINAVKFKASIEEIKLKIPSLKTMISGGIELTTKIKDNNPKEKYKLFDDKEDIDYNQNSFNLVTSSKEKLTKIIFKDMEIGKVVDSFYDIKSDKQILTVKLKNRFAYILKNSPNFYINTPKLDIENINLKNIIKSPFIEVNIKNKKSEIKDSYVLNSFIPVRDGYEFSFQTKSDVFKGYKIKYRGVEVGEVSEVNIKNSSLLIKAKIYKEYKSLINNSTYFYKLSAVEMKASLKESYINFSNAKEAVFGGIGFITPKKNKLTKKEFLLFDSKEKLKKYLYSKDGGKFITILVSNLDFIKNGTSINYKGFSIGEVISYKLNSKINLIEVEVYIKKEYRNLINKSTKFFKDSGVDVSIGFDGVKVASKPIEGFVNGVISMKSSLNKEDFTSRFKLLTKEELTKENYFFVNVIMSDGFDLKVGSKLMFKSLKIGEVEKISLDNNITASVKIDKKYKKYFGQNSKIWLENLKLGVQGIKNLSAPILGSNLYLLSDEENGFKDRFILDSITPADTKYLKGLRILLKAKLRGSLKIDAPVYYRRVVIGQIEHIDLSSDGKFVDVKIFIYPQYSHFIRKNTHFYNTSIMGMEVGLFSAKLSIGTLETLFKGGVEIATPDNAGELATNGELFYLKNENHEDWLKWEPDLDLKGE